MVGIKNEKGEIIMMRMIQLLLDHYYLPIHLNQNTYMHI